MRPKIICHIVTSIDGRLHPSRFTAPARGVDPALWRGHHDKAAKTFGAEGWIVGRTTMQEIVPPRLARTRRVAGANSKVLPYMKLRKSNSASTRLGFC